MNLRFAGSFKTSLQNSAVNEYSNFLKMLDSERYLLFQFKEKDVFALFLLVSFTTLIARPRDGYKWLIILPTT